MNLQTTYMGSRSITRQAEYAPDFSRTVSWAKRLAKYRGTHWQRGCLESIRDDADRAGEGEWSCAAVYALDSGDLSDLDWLIAEQDEDERQHERRRAFECRAGKLSDWMEA